jgi:ubiquinone biosynthesis protein
VLEQAAATFFNQVFRDGFFHGDQHPGNLFVTPEGAIGAVDFGIMGRLSPAHRDLLADMLLATLSRDYRGLAEAHVSGGLLPPEANVALFAQALRAVCEPIFGRPLSQVSFGRLLGQLLRLTRSFSVPVQPELVLLQKNMLMAEGVSRRLDPQLNIWVLAEPLIRAWVAKNRGLERRLSGTAEELTRNLLALPRAVVEGQRALASLSRGGVLLPLPPPRRQPRPVAWLALLLALAALLIASLR